MSEGPRGAGWYPDPSDDLFLRWWDGAQWTPARVVWEVDAFGRPRWRDPASRSGQLTLWCLRHPVVCGLVVFGTNLGVLSVGELFLHGDWPLPVALATSQGLLWGAVAWRGRRRNQRQHQTFWSAG